VMVHIRADRFHGWRLWHSYSFPHHRSKNKRRRGDLSRTTKEHSMSIMSPAAMPCLLVAGNGTEA
jgi:hypothetical protein